MSRDHWIGLTMRLEGTTGSEDLIKIFESMKTREGVSLSILGAQAI